MIHYLIRFSTFVGETCHLELEDLIVPLPWASHTRHPCRPLSEGGGRLSAGPAGLS